jgi:hypothetical protein
MKAGPSPALRARKMNPIPTFKNGRPSSNTSSKAIDYDVLLRIIRPPKRINSDDIDEVGSFTLSSVGTSLNAQNVIPPINSQGTRVSSFCGSRAVSAHENSVTEHSKKVRVQDSAIMSSDTIHSPIAAEFELVKVPEQSKALQSAYFHLGLEDEDTAKKTFREPFEFINFLISKPQSNDFVYMNPVKIGYTNFNPYNLEICEYSEVDRIGGYFTLSRAVKAKISNFCVLF